MQHHHHADVLAVDPDRVNLCALRHCFHHAGVEARLARSADDARRDARERTPGVALVSLALGKDDAIGLIRGFRREYATSRLPILVLAEEGQEELIGEALQSGASDYVLLPEEEPAFVARVGRMLGWSLAPGAGRMLSAGPVIFDVDRSELVSPRPSAPLTPCEARILRWLLTPPGRAYTRRQLLAAHRPAFPPGAEERSVDAHVASLRKKLGAWGGCIETRRGVGYRFDPARAEAAAAGSVSA
ncbi:MAG TPA: response regulator transcription factor [Planctomycetota bacterium]|nr:response regulator transcription factor [Planctomycetota bacterium]